MADDILTRFLKEDAVKAHAMFDKLNVPTTRRTLNRNAQAYQNVTLSISERLEYVVALLNVYERKV